MRVEGIERHLHGVERKSGVQHLEMDAGIFVAGKADEAHFALLLRFAQGFGGAIRANEQLGIVVEGDAVDLPQVEMIGLQPAQRLFQHLHGEASVAAVRADLGHQEDFVAAALQALAHPVFGFAAVVFPAVVEERDAAVDGLLNESNGGGDVGSVAEVMAAEAECRNTEHRACQTASSGSRRRSWTLH